MGEGCFSAECLKLTPLSIPLLGGSILYQGFLFAKMIGWPTDGSVLDTIEGQYLVDNRTYLLGASLLLEFMLHNHGQCAFVLSRREKNGCLPKPSMGRVACRQHPLLCVTGRLLSSPRPPPPLSPLRRLCSFALLSLAHAPSWITSFA